MGNGIQYQRALLMGLQSALGSKGSNAEGIRCQSQSAKRYGDVSTQAGTQPLRHRVLTEHLRGREMGQ